MAEMVNQVAAAARQAEELLLRRQVQAASTCCLEALQQRSPSWSPARWERLSGVQLLSVAVQSCWSVGSQEELQRVWEQQAPEGLLELPAQVFVLWQVMQLEAGCADTCKAQIEAYLARRFDQNCLAEGTPHPDAAHLVALCRLYAVDLLMEALQRPTQEACDFVSGAWLPDLLGLAPPGRLAHEPEVDGKVSGGAAWQLLAGLRAEVAARAITSGSAALPGLASSSGPAAAPAPGRGTGTAGADPPAAGPSGATATHWQPVSLSAMGVSGSLAAYLAPGGALGNPFCTLLGEVDGTAVGGEGDGDSRNKDCGGRKEDCGGGGGAGDCGADACKPQGQGGATATSTQAPCSPQGVDGAAAVQLQAGAAKPTPGDLLAAEGLALLIGAVANSKVTARAVLPTSSVTSAAASPPQRPGDVAQDQGPGVSRPTQPTAQLEAQHAQRHGGRTRPSAPPPVQTGSLPAQARPPNQPGSREPPPGVGVAGSQGTAAMVPRLGRWPAMVHRRLALAAQLLCSPPSEAWDALWALGVALLLLAVYRERRVLRVRAASALRGVASVLGQLAGMAITLRPNPVGRG